MALITALLVVLLWPAGVAGAAGVGRGLDLVVRPAVGKRRTHFVVSFTAQLTGFTFPDSSAYQVFVSGGSRTCTSAQRVSAPPTIPGERVHVVLRPSGHSARWCRGRYAGHLYELFRPVCSFRTLCPLIVGPRPDFIIVMTLGTFRMRVR